MGSKRDNIVRELVETERSYVSSLQTLVTTFLDPLSSGAGSLSPKDARHVFANIRQILQFQELLLAALTEELDAHGPDLAQVGRVMASLMKAHRGEVDGKAAKVLVGEMIEAATAPAAPRAVVAVKAAVAVAARPAAKPAAVAVVAAKPAAVAAVTKSMSWLAIAIEFWHINPAVMASPANEYLNTLPSGIRPFVPRVTPRASVVEVTSSSP